GIFPGQSHRPDLGFANSPMQNLPRIAPAETALLPNVRILRRSRAQRDELRRIVEKVPLHAVHAGAARRIKLSNDSTARIEDVDFWRRSEEHTSELQSRGHLVCRLLLEK